MSACMPGRYLVKTVAARVSRRISQQPVKPSPAPQQPGSGVEAAVQSVKMTFPAALTHTCSPLSHTRTCSAGTHVPEKAGSRARLLVDSLVQFISSYLKNQMRNEKESKEFSNERERFSTSARGGKRGHHQRGGIPRNLQVKHQEVTAKLSFHVVLVQQQRMRQKKTLFNVCIIVLFFPPPPPLPHPSLHINHMAGQRGPAAPLARSLAPLQSRVGELSGRKDHERTAARRGALFCRGNRSCASPLPFPLESKAKKD